MKKAVFILLLFPILSLAKFYKATVILNDESIKKGFVELPEYFDDKYLKFKIDDKGKTEKLSIDLIKGFEIINDKNLIVKFATVYLADPKPFTTDKFTLNSKKSWVKILLDDVLKIYAASASYNNSTGTGGFSTLHVQKKNDKYAYFFADGGGNGFNFNVNGFQNTKKYLNSIFGVDCPKLVSALNKDDFNTKGINYLLELYLQNCGKN